MKRGDIVWVDCRNAVGHEQKSASLIRPAIVVSNDKSNLFSDVVEVVYLTSSRRKKPLPTHVLVNYGKHGGKSLALCECVYSVDKMRISEDNRNSHLPDEDMRAVNKALIISLELNG